MSEEILWEKFVQTGSIADYMAYSALKNKNEYENVNSRGNRP